MVLLYFVLSWTVHQITPLGETSMSSKSSLFSRTVHALQGVRERMFKRFRDRVYPATFEEEINEQCDIFFPLYSLPFFVAWLPYLSLDPLVIPDQPLFPYLRIGLTVVGVLALILRHTWRNPARHRLIGNGMMYYLIIATGLITGLAKAHPSYVGGYCFLITVLGAMPVQPRHLYLALGLSLATFGGLCWHFQVSFVEPAARYSLQDLISTVGVSVLMSTGWTMLRRNSYEKGRALQQMNVQIQEQQRLLAEQNESLRHLNMEKDELIGIVSHDLRNPLASILGMTEVLTSDADDLSPELRAGMLTRVHDAGIRMRSLIDRLLSANAIENGVLKPSLGYVNVSKIAMSVLQNHRNHAEQKSIEVLLDGDESAVCYADALFVRQIVENLLSNAIKYSHPQSQVLMRVCQYEPNVVIEVRDKGQGLTKEDLAKVFRKFGRLSAKPTGGEQSIGLGLSIVKKMVESMNGNVWCESEFGQGATFFVELPSFQNEI